MVDVDENARARPGVCQKPLRDPKPGLQAPAIMPQVDRMNGRPAVVAARDRTPGTPSRKDKPRESSAVQDPGLKDYVCDFHQAKRGDGRLHISCAATWHGIIANKTPYSAWENVSGKEPLAPSTRLSTGAQARPLQ